MELINGRYSSKYYILTRMGLGERQYIRAFFQFTYIVSLNSCYSHYLLLFFFFLLGNRQAIGMVKLTVGEVRDYT